jgi:hypothetical protein
VTPPPSPLGPTPAFTSPVDWPSAPPAEPPLRSTSPLSSGGNWPAPRPQPGPAGPPPPPRRTGLIVAITALTIAILIATFAAGMLVNRDSSPSAAPASTTTTTAKKSTTTTTEDTGGVDPGPTPTTPRPTDPGSGSNGTINKAELDATIEDIKAFVEKDREHPFKNDVAVEVLERPEFEKRVLESFDSETESMERQGNLLKALGLIPADLDVVESQRKLLGSGVLGYYDPTTKELVVGGDHIGPFLREVLAHELTHALEDQYFDLGRAEVDGVKDGSDWAFLALVEGSAKRVENDYVEAMSDADRRTLEQEEYELGIDQLDAMLSTPMVLAQIQLTPYDYGEPFVRALVEEHGIEGLDAAFSAPPTTSEQVLHNDKFDDHEGAIGVPVPGTDGTATDDGVLGELMTGIVLAGGGVDPLGGLGNLSPEELQDLIDRMMNGEISEEELNEILGGLGGAGGGSGLGVVDTIEGWGGDHYVVWTSDTKGVCVRVTWKMDSAAALRDMKAALDKWAAADPGKPTIEAPADDAVAAIRCSGPTDGSGPTTPSSRPPRTTTPTTTLS